jgi:hypothetical protein
MHYIQHHQLPRGGSMLRFFGRRPDGAGRPPIRFRRLTTVLVSGLALSLTVPGQAFADPRPSPKAGTGKAGPAKPGPGKAVRAKADRRSTAMIDGKPGFVNLAAGKPPAGTKLVQPKSPAGKPFTQKQLADRARSRAVAEKQLSFVESSTLDRPAAAGTALAPGADLPTRPLDADQNDCLNSGGADSTLGRVHNRFLYCLKRGIQVEYWEVDDKGIPVEKAGTSTLGFTIMAYGSKQSRSIRVFFKADEDSADYDWGPIDNILKAPKQHLVVDVRCINNVLPDLRCGLGGYAVSKTFSEWDDGPDWVSWDITSAKPTLAESDVDYKWLHDWQVTFQGGAEDEYKTIVPGHTESRSMRCDSATYFKNQPESCTFDDVIPHLTYSTSDPKVAEAAVHIREAQNDPNSSYPLVSPPRDKLIPGKYTGSRGDPGLHRIPNSDPQAAQNTDHKDAACYGRGPERLNYIGLGLPTAPDTSFQDCDEYPFRATQEGAASTVWDFSVKAINNRQNRSAGSRLGKYFTADRILLYDRDSFYVEIIDGGGPFDPGSDAIVDAGPDVSGTEGSMIYLAGYAEASEEGSVHWSARPVSGTDAGATCRFSDPLEPATFVTCNDDGLFEVTLTSDDGSDAAFSDSALVTVGNAPPVLSLTGPDPWQLFRVNTPVDVTARFSDAGGNDSHTCSITWDDGTDTSFGAADNCNRSHTFTRAGMFTMNVTVTDDDGASDSASVMVVVYDPFAGFANADGSLAAPAGSLTSSPDVAGEGWFHLTAKYYQPNDTVPKGAARTWLTGTGFRLDTISDTSLEWLVVTPDGKIAAKGRGTVGGNAGYGFVFYGYDGCANGGAAGCRPGPDQFRTVVWEGGAGSHPGSYTLFDTSRGANYDVDLAAPKTLTSGQLTVQKP